MDQVANRDFQTRAALLIALAALTGCGEDARMERIHSLMTNELDDAADGIWEAAGYVITAAGEQSLYPSTDEEWRAVASSADDLAGLAEKMKGPDYALDDGDWAQISDGLVIAAGRARLAAEARDKEELFEAGGHIYRVCVSCHQAYAPGMSGEDAQ